MPGAQPQQLLAELVQRGGAVPQRLVLHRVADQGPVPGRRADLAPGLDPGTAQLLGLLQGGHHRQVLHRTHLARRGVAGHSVRQQAVPDQQVAGLQLRSHDGELVAVDGRPDRVPVGRLPQPPLLEPAEQLRVALEPAVVGPGVVQRDDPLHPLRQHAERGVHVPVQLDVEARVGGGDQRPVAVPDVGRVQVEPVQRHPQLLAVPHVDERVIDALRLAAVPDQLVVVRLDEPVDVQLPVQVVPVLPLLVPGVRPLGVEPLELPGEVEQPPCRGSGDRLLDDDVAVRLPVREVRLGEHPQRPRLLDVPQRGLREVRLGVRAEVGGRGGGAVQVSGVGRRHAVTPELEKCAVAEGEGRPVCSGHGPSHGALTSANFRYFNIGLDQLAMSTGILGWSIQWEVMKPRFRWGIC